MYDDELLVNKGSIPKEPPARISALIDDEVFYTPKAYESFLLWASELNSFGSLEERRYLRLAGGKAKKFREEILPLRSFLASQPYSKDCTISIGKEGAKADVTLQVKFENPIPIQITRVIDGENERHQMQMLTELGSVGGGRIEKRKLGSSEYVLTDKSEMRSVDEAQDKLITGINERINAKSNPLKSYSSDTWLLVVFDDTAMLSSNRMERIISEVKLAALSSPFSKVFLVGPAMGSDPNEWPSYILK